MGRAAVRLCCCLQALGRRRASPSGCLFKGVPGVHSAAAGLAVDFIAAVAAYWRWAAGGFTVKLSFTGGPDVPSAAAGLAVDFIAAVGLSS